MPFFCRGENVNKSFRIYNINLSKVSRHNHKSNAYLILVEQIFSDKPKNSGRAQFVFQTGSKPKNRTFYHFMGMAEISKSIHSLNQIQYSTFQRPDQTKWWWFMLSVCAVWTEHKEHLCGFFLLLTRLQIVYETRNEDWLYNVQHRLVYTILLYLVSPT